MESKSTKFAAQDKAFIQSPKVNRISSKSHDKYFEEDKKHEIKPEIHCSTKRTGSSLLNRLFDFIQSDDALLLFVILILLQDGTDDEILLLLIIYLFMSGTSAGFFGLGTKPT